MSKDQEFEKVEINKIGPMWKMEGDIILYPSLSYPIRGYKQKDSKLTESFFNSIQKWVNEWWDSFPNCCDSHKRFNSIQNFDKQIYGFVKDQILLSVRYFIHCMEENIDQDDWFEKISQYYDYLKMNFGSPGWGDHIFEKAAITLIEVIKFDTVDFDDEMRYKLLDHILPSRKEIEERKKNNGDIGELYNIFQEWLNSIPSFGEIATIKQRLTGKVPMNLFLTDIQVNQYSGLAWSNVKSVDQLVIDLKKFTESLLLAIHGSLKEKFTNDNKTVLVLIDEQLRLKEKEILEKKNRPNIQSARLVIEWLDMWINYFNNLTTAKTNGKLDNFIRNTNTFLHEYVNIYDLLDLSIAELRKDISVLMEKIDAQSMNIVKSISEKIFKSIEDENLSDEEIESISNRIIEKLEQSRDSKVKNTVTSLKKSHVAVKNKIKICIPLFLFTKYEGEIELNASDKIPSSYKELKRLFFETSENK